MKKPRINTVKFFGFEFRFVKGKAQYFISLFCGILSANFALMISYFTGVQDELPLFIIAIGIYIVLIYKMHNFHAELVEKQDKLPTL